MANASRFITYDPISESVFNVEHWFGDKPPRWKHLPSAGKAKEYSQRQISLLRRARRPRKVSAY